MPNIEISSAQIDSLIELFTREEEDADKLIREAKSKKSAAVEMLKQLNKLKNDIAYVSNRFNIKTARSDGYDANLIWLKKIRFVLEKHGPMTMSQIVDKLINEYEPELNRNSAISNVSVILITKTAEGKEFEKTVNNENENVYMLKPEEEFAFYAGKN